MEGSKRWGQVTGEVRASEQMSEGELFLVNQWETNALTIFARRCWTVCESVVGEDCFGCCCSLRYSNILREPDNVSETTDTE